MSIETQYQEADYAQMTEIGHAHPDNAFVFSLSRKSDRPLRYLHLKPEGRYMVALNEDGLLTGAATLYPYEMGESSLYKNESAYLLSQTSVRKEWQSLGIASRLLQMVFAAAAERDLLLISTFEKDGQSYLSRIFPRLHAQHSALKVFYRNQLRPITGERSYELDFFPDGQEHIEFV